MSQKQYWKGLEDYNRPATHNETAENEFREELPFDLSTNLLEATTPRRDFLKYLGFSTLAATLVASCEMPVRKAIPYAIKPEDIVPGVPNYYASTFTDGGDYCAIIIKTRDGRPIKIEGNPGSSITQGGTSARVQASVLNLYDKARLRYPGSPVIENGKVEYKESTNNAIDRIVMDALKASTQPVYLLTSSILSPTTKEIISQFLAKYPSAKHVVYDAVSYSGMLQANEACYGKRALPVYHFDKAQTIVSLGADFLGTWLSPIEFAKGYSKGRKISAKDLRLSKHYQFEANHSITGANADHRATCKPSEIGAVAVALYNVVVNGTQPSFSNKNLNDLISKAATDLKKGNGLVVCGSNDVATQTIVNAINDKIGSNGTTINWAANSNYKQGIDADMVSLVEAMNAGQVGALFMHGVNPVYDYYYSEKDANKFVTGLSKVPLTVSFAERMDETAQKCKYIIPDHHYLENWGDAEPRTGYISLQQPGIAPLFKTRAFQDSLLIWAGATTTNYADYWKQYWLTKLGSQENLDKAIQDGIIEPAMPMAATGATFTGNVSDAISKIQNHKSGSVELLVYEKVGIGYGGAWSNNPWLLEMPDPLTKATWDNYICVSPKRAKDMGAELNGQNEVDSKKHMAKVKGNNYEVLLPLVVVPGMHNDVIAIAVGFGRDANVGRAAASDPKTGQGGRNVYPFVTYNGQTFDHYNTGITIEPSDQKYDIAITQQHLSYEARPVIFEYTFDEFSKDPLVLIKERNAEIKEFSELSWEENSGSQNQVAMSAGQEADKIDEDYRENGTLYPVYDSPGIHWGMSIDLNSCIGCGACTIGCQAENNVSVVGKEHVLKAHEMHWLRIDRYFSGIPEDPDSIQTVFQPMLCQHCDNAPCENVCPVSATNHSSEGLNQMVYNRCIGTKYCANNCPYKVRRFNWMDWNGADCFADNLYEDYRRDDINDDLTRMVLNPDVTVRSRGVMEKCSFCVQRLQEAKLNAKRDDRPMKDGEAKTACQLACPTDAIVFGNVNDKESAIYKLRHNEQRERLYHVLENLHTLANVNYLAKVRNTDEINAGDESKDEILKYHI
jgi:molybdopterin-containing oxidoreductase family iron-sulfur binding subunit